MNPYVECPTIKTKSFTIRLIRESDRKSLFRCYNDKRAVELAIGLIFTKRNILLGFL